MSWLENLLGTSQAPQMDTSALTTQTGFGSDYEKLLRQRMTTGYNTPDQQAAGLRNYQLPIQQNYQQGRQDINSAMASKGMLGSGANNTLMLKAMQQRGQQTEQAGQAYQDQQNSLESNAMSQGASYANSQLNAVQNSETQQRQAQYQNAMMNFQQKMAPWQLVSQIGGQALGMYMGGGLLSAGKSALSAGGGRGGMDWFGGTTAPMGQKYGPGMGW